MAISEDFVAFINQLNFYTRKMELEFTCPCCSNMLEVPTVLPCNHIFCSQCIIRTEDNQYKCPSCQTSFLHKDLRHSTHMDEMTSVFKNLEAYVVSLHQELHSQTGSSGPEHCEELDIYRSVASGTNVQPDSSGTRNGSIERNSQEVTKTSPPSDSQKDAIDATKMLHSPEPTNSRIQHTNLTIEDVVSPRTCSFTRSKRWEMERMYDCEPNKQSSLLARNSYSSPQINTSTAPKHSIPEEDCICLGDKFTDKKQSSHVTTTRGKMPLMENRVAVQDNGDVTPEGMTVRPEETNVMRNCSTKRNLDECFKGTKISALSDSQKNSIEKEAEAMLHSPETDNGKMKDAGPATNNINSSVPSSAPSASSFKRLKKQYLSEIFNTVDSKPRIHLPTQSTSSRPQIEPFSPKGCNLEDKCNELKMNARGECSGWMLCESGISKSEEVLLVKFASLTGANVTKCYNKNTTHLIVSTDSRGACKRTVKVLKAILNGQWILTIDWIKDCIIEGRLVSEEQYEVNKVDIGNRICLHGPMRGRLSALNKAPKMFSGTRFYFVDQFEPLQRNTWEDLVMEADATVLRKNDSTLPDVKSSTYIVFNEAHEEEWTEDERRVVVNKRTDQVVELKNKTGFPVIGHKCILDMIAECGFAKDLVKYIVM